MTTGLPLAQVSHAHGFINGRDDVRTGRRIHGHHGQAHAVVGHALVNFKLGGKRRSHREVKIAALLFNGSDGAEGFNNSSKHESWI